VASRLLNFRRMTFTAVLLATLLAVPSAPNDESAVTEDEPGAPRVVQRTKQKWLPDAEADAQMEAPSRSKVAPAIVMGLSVVAGIAGTVFLTKTLAALDRTDQTLGIGLNTAGGPMTTVPVINTEALRDQQRDVLTNGIATTTLLSASIAGLVTSTVLLISD
jgi:hypothetical protein